MVSKWFFMHLIATYLPVFIDWAFRTSLKVPSPFLLINRYSKFVLPFLLTMHIFSVIITNY
jgi:hypothetical protein